jgi:hypothetical protein
MSWHLPSLPFHNVRFRSLLPRIEPLVLFWLSHNPTGGFPETHLAISRDERDLTTPCQQNRDGQVSSPHSGRVWQWTRTTPELEQSSGSGYKCRHGVLGTDQFNWTRRVSPSHKHRYKWFGSTHNDSNLSWTVNMWKWTRWVLRFFPMISGDHTDHVNSGTGVRETGKPEKNL